MKIKCISKSINKIAWYIYDRRACPAGQLSQLSTVLGSDRLVSFFALIGVTLVARRHDTRRRIVITLPPREESAIQRRSGGRRSAAWAETIIRLESLQGMTRKDDAVWSRLAPFHEGRHRRCAFHYSISFQLELVKESQCRLDGWEAKFASSSPVTSTEISSTRWRRIKRLWNVCWNVALVSFPHFFREAGLLLLLHAFAEKRSRWKHGFWNVS